MTRILRMGTLSLSLLAAMPAWADGYSLLVGGRSAGSDSTLGYLSFSGGPGTNMSDGWVYRLETEATETTFAGATSNQQMQRILAGYSFATDTGTFTVLAGPTRVERDAGPVELISETGYYVGLEGSGFIGDRGYWAGVVQWSSPEEAFYARGFGTYLVEGSTNIGPDVSYLHEPDYERTTIGIRGSWVLGNTVIGVVGGSATQSGSAGPSETDGFIEMQVGISF